MSIGAHCFIFWGIRFNFDRCRCFSIDDEGIVRINEYPHDGLHTSIDRQFARIFLMRTDQAISDDTDTDSEDGSDEEINHIKRKFKGVLESVRQLNYENWCRIQHRDFIQNGIGSQSESESESESDDDETIPDLIAEHERIEAFPDIALFGEY